MSLKADHKKGPSPLAGEKQKARYRGCLRWPSGIEWGKGGWFFTFQGMGCEAEASGSGQQQSLLKGAWIGPPKLPKRPRTKSEDSKAEGKPKARFAGVQPIRVEREQEKLVFHSPGRWVRRGAGSSGQLQGLLKGAWIGPLKLPKRPSTKSEGSEAKGKPIARFVGVQPSGVEQEKKSVFHSPGRRVRRRSGWLRRGTVSPKSNLIKLSTY